MAKKRRLEKAVQTTAASLKNKIAVSWRNLVIFFVLFAASFILYIVSSNPLLVNLFWILSMIFGFLSLALLIVLIVFLILKSGKK